LLTIAHSTTNRNAIFIVRRWWLCSSVSALVFTLTRSQNNPTTGNTSLANSYSRTTFLCLCNNTRRRRRRWLLMECWWSTCTLPIWSGLKEVTRWWCCGSDRRGKKSRPNIGRPRNSRSKASLGRQVLEPEEWPSSSLMGDIAAPIDAAVGC
jgi:hypothetical protein